MRTPIVLALALTLSAPAWAGEAAEAAAAELLEMRMKTERPEDLQLLKSVKGKEIIVVKGSMDHIESVLQAAHIRHTVIQPNQVQHTDLHANQIVMVNCPGTMPAAGVQRIAKFVRAGGLLYTTDWALLNVVQKAFPHTIAHNGRGTGDHVTAVQVKQKDDNIMAGVLLTKNTQPQWWLEGGSYPIKILDKKRVKVLASSRQMQQQYGADPVMVRFRWEDGEVIHVVSHFYRQIGTQGANVAADKMVDGIDGLTAEQKKSFKASGKGGAKMSDVESSYGFQRATSNIIVGKKKRNQALDKEYNFEFSDETVVEGERVPKGRRAKVIEKKDGKWKVRDDRGNEDWVAPAELAPR